MANAPHDNNNIPVAMGLDNGDGATPLALRIDPTSHTLDVDDDTSGSDAGGSRAIRDDNYVPVLIAASESDGVTPVAIYIDTTTKKLLIDST